MLTSTDIDRRYAKARRLDNTTAAIAQNYIDLLHGTQVAELPQRTEDRGAIGTLNNEIIDHLVDDAAIRIGIGAGENEVQFR